MTNAMRPGTRLNWHSRVEAAVAQIFATLDDDLHWRTLAESLNASPWHFHRCFKQLTGETVQQCMRRIRLEKAAWLVINTPMRITDIALAAGFETLEAFLKAFRTAHGISPGNMRDLVIWKGRLPAPSNLHYAPGRPRQHFFISPSESTNMDIKITTLPPHRMYCLRNTGDYWGLQATWKRFVDALGAAGYPFPPKQSMTIFHDHLYTIPMEERRADTAFNQAGDISLSEGLFEYETPGGLYAVKAHFGSCEEIGNVWDRWRKDWLATSGWQLDTDRPSLEWYQNNPEETLPELQLTLLCDPVKPLA